MKSFRFCCITLMLPIGITDALRVNSKGSDLRLVLECFEGSFFTLRHFFCCFVELGIFLHFIDFDSLLLDWNWRSVGTCTKALIISL